MADQKNGMKVTSHVLSKFDVDDQASVKQGLDKAIQASDDIIRTNDFVAAMNKYNGK